MLNGQTHQSSGFAMIEVLISVVILSVALLGLAGLQVVGMKGTQHAVMTTQATLLTQRLAEKIRANPDGNYNQAIDCSVAIPQNCSLHGCDPDQLAVYDLYRVQCGMQIGADMMGGISNTLINGRLQIVCPAGLGAACNITTLWDEHVIDENQVTVNDVVPKQLQLVVAK